MKHLLFPLLCSSNKLSYGKNAVITTNYPALNRLTLLSKQLQIKAKKVLNNYTFYAHPSTSLLGIAFEKTFYSKHASYI